MSHQCGKLFDNYDPRYDKRCDIQRATRLLIVSVLFYSFLSCHDHLVASHTMTLPSADGLQLLRPSNFVTTSLPYTFWLVIAATLAATVPGASAYTWNLRNNPQQCQNLTIDLIGGDGQPPFRILIIPFGPSPLPNNTEARRIQEIVFATGDAKNGNVMLNYPENSQFVAVVSSTAVSHSYSEVLRFWLGFISLQDLSCAAVRCRSAVYGNVAPPTTTDAPDLDGCELGCNDNSWFCLFFCLLPCFDLKLGYNGFN